MHLLAHFFHLIGAKLRAPQFLASALVSDLPQIIRRNPPIVVGPPLPDEATSGLLCRQQFRPGHGLADQEKALHGLPEAIPLSQTLLK